MQEQIDLTRLTFRRRDGLTFGWTRFPLVPHAIGCVGVDLPTARMFVGQQPRSRGSHAASGTPAAPSTIISQHQAAGSTAGRHGARQAHWGPNPNVGDGRDPSLAAGRIGVNDADDDDEDEQLVTTSILAINAAKGKIGCSYYDAMTNKLYFIEDQRDSTEWDLCSLSMPSLSLRCQGVTLLSQPTLE